MKLTDVFTPRAIAAQWTQDPSNQTAYLGAGLFPARKKAGLDLKWFRGHKGLPVSLTPSNFDAKATLMTREGFTAIENEMAFFRASKVIGEKIEQEILRVSDSSDPYLQDILTQLYDDANSLIDSANVVAERMRMQLLCPDQDGSPRILISHKGVQYAYSFDSDGSYREQHYKAMSAAADKWTDPASSNPLKDLSDAADAVENLTGTRPTRALMNRNTFNQLKANERVRSAVLAQNVTANVYMNDARMKELMSTELGLTPVVYSKRYRDENGDAHPFYKDGFVTLLPEGYLGNTWYGITPEERTLMGSGKARVSIVNTGIAITTVINENPVFTETIASEILLPSFQRMDETYVLKVY